MTLLFVLMWYRLELELVTTSDWTYASFDNAWVDEQKADREGVLTGPLSVGNNRGELRVRAVVYLRFDRDAELEIGRGDLGATTVTIRGVGTFRNDGITGDGRNRRRFALPAEKIRALGSVKFETRRRPEKRVLAFYYPWYGPGIHWDPKNHNAATHTPRLGLYDSRDEKVIRRHLEWAREAGVDGFISSWWGRGDFTDQATRTLVEIAEREKFQVTAYHEAAEDEKQLAEDLAYLVKKYGSSPAWLKVDGKPVIFLYVRVAAKFSPAAFAKVRGSAVLMMDTLDVTLARAGGGMHTYNPVFEDPARLGRQYEALRVASDVHGFVFAATVVPGFDNRYVDPKPAIRDREGGRLYERFWEAAVASDPDWILVCSWNEWHEGSEIEPSVELGDAYLKKTAAWSRAWKKR